MKILKKYTAIKLSTKTEDEKVKVSLSYGNITGPYYSKTYPEEQFDTEEEAIQYAYNIDPWAKWLILPIIIFDNFD